MRTAFIQQLMKEAETNEHIFLIVGDLGYSVVEPFRDKFADRFLNAGIAEQNMAGMAAGLAKEGYNVYIYSIANFPTLRCMEQIRYDIAYHNLNVKIVSVGAGYAYASLGASHHATEDIGMMRTIPNMVVCSPGDPVEAQAITKFSSHYDGPMYLRLGKAGEKVVHTDSLENIQMGEILPVIKKQSRQAVIASGAILAYAANRIKDEEWDLSLYSIPFVKPINQESLLNVLAEYDCFTIIEEHQKSCGAGSAFIEQVSDLYAQHVIKEYPHIQRIAIDDKFFHVAGNQQELREMAGLGL